MLSCGLCALQSWHVPKYLIFNHTVPSMLNFIGYLTVFGICFDRPISNMAGLSLLYYILIYACSRNLKWHVHLKTHSSNGMSNCDHNQLHHLWTWGPMQCRHYISLHSTGNIGGQCQLFTRYNSKMIMTDHCLCCGMPINMAIPPEYCPATFANQMNILLEEPTTGII